jgi:hypothetical protein
MTLDAILRCSHSGGRAADEALALHQDLLRLVALRERYQDTLGYLAALFQVIDGWRHLGFASFEQFCEDRLGMDVTEVEQLAARARRSLRRSRNADVRAAQ